MKRVLLLDGDIFAYNAAVVAESEDDFGDGFTVLWSDWQTALRIAREQIDGLMDRLNAEQVVFCLTDTKNWRKYVVPTYKDNRKSVRKPIALARLKAELAEIYRTELWPTLEADDVMGILATRDSFMPDYEKIIVSSDKDLRTIPATVFNPTKDTRPKRISRADADLWLYAQAIGGDATDGYKGCEGIGVKTALEHLEKLQGYERYTHTFKSGQRKGLSEERWRKVEMPDYWSVAKSLYERAGLSEEYAISQAQVARILRDEDYNQETQQITLWRPDHETKSKQPV